MHVYNTHTHTHGGHSFTQQQSVIRNLWPAFHTQKKGNCRREREKRFHPASLPGQTANTEKEKRRVKGRE